ncbi:MAG: flagellar biosynthesis protein FlhB [Nitrospirae bacterium]|nr:flagellar biosynthesis protein FlhB [Nitrospirota bacterium]
MADDQERNERPTARRRQKAREEGQVPRSKELAGMLSFGGVLLALMFMGGFFVQQLLVITRTGFIVTDKTSPLERLTQLGERALIMLLPVLLLSMVFGITGNLVQGGFVWKPFKLDLNMLNPAEGIKRIFSRHAIMEIIKGLVKFSVGALLIYLLMKRLLPELFKMIFMDVSTMSAFLISSLMYTMKVVFICFFIVSFLDYINQKWRHERSLRMTKEEIKEEYKETEGDPQIKARIRSIQREMARKRMMQEVPKATVVITNPTHLAVALRYERGQKGAPKVVAKGAGFIAEKIKLLAEKSGVPVVEDKPLARALFMLDIDTEIPEELYRAVAKILAYIYRLKGEVA